MKKSLFIMIFGLALMTIAGHCLGTVFWKRGLSLSQGLPEFGTGWKRIFTSPVRINGSQGNLEILGCDENFFSVRRRLRHSFASFPKLMDFQENDSIAWGIIQSKGYILRILALGIEPQAQSVVFVLAQSKHDYEKSLGPSNRRFLQEMLVYPGSKARTFVEIIETRAQLEISVAPGLPDNIHAFFQSAFPGNGWKQMTPTMDSRTESSKMTIYQKGFEICCVMVRESGRPAESIITVLHKRLNVE